MTDAHRTEDHVAANAKRLGNEPSVPVPYETNGKGDYVVRDVYGGLTKREVFAAMAMQGLRAGIDVYDPQEMAKMAVADADALLKELAK